MKEGRMRRRKEERHRVKNWREKKERKRKTRATWIKIDEE